MAKASKPRSHWTKTETTGRLWDAAQRKIVALDNRLKRLEWRVTMIEATVGIDPWRPAKQKKARR